MRWRLPIPSVNAVSGTATAGLAGISAASDGGAWTGPDGITYRTRAPIRMTAAAAASTIGRLRRSRFMGTNKMWGGRFAGGPADIMAEINVSIEFDKRLAAEDIAGSRAHARMLADQGIITQEDGAAILQGLDQVEKEIKDGTFTFKREFEDIH